MKFLPYSNTHVSSNKRSSKRLLKFWIIAFKDFASNKEFVQCIWFTTAVFYRCNEKKNKYKNEYFLPKKILCSHYLLKSDNTQYKQELFIHVYFILNSFFSIFVWCLSLDSDDPLNHYFVDTSYNDGGFVKFKFYFTIHRF